MATGTERRSHWLVRWFDSYAGPDVPWKGQKLVVDWPRVIPFMLMHAACFSVIWVGWSWTAVALAVGMYFLRMFAITGFYHRYFSHRTFKTSRWMQFVMAVLGGLAVQRGALWWAAHHREHHRHSDEENDFHSPRQHGFIFSHMGWFTTKEAFKTNLKAIPDLAKFPELVFLDRFDVIVPLVYGFALYIAGAVLERFAPGLGTSGWQLFVWGFFISTIAVYHGTYTINSLAHVWGGRRFTTSDDSRNNFVLSVITMGEGWHNNHHHYPGSVRQGFYWWEWDPTYYTLWLMSKVGLVWDLNGVPARVYERALAEKQAAKSGQLVEVKPEPELARDAA